MPPVSDLVQDSKLETTFYGNCTRHVYHVSGANPRERKMRKEEHWERCRNLGTGTFGTVWLEKLAAGNDEDKYRAVKEIRKNVKLSGAIDYGRELEAIAKFSHQKYNMCFVKSFGWFESPECVFIAMEYFPLGDLQNHLSSPLLEIDTQQITFQVLEGLSFMHYNGFAHRDLKPANILVQSGGPDWWVKIGDFGISKRVGEGLTALRTFSGTPGFLAPEVLAQNGYFGDYNSGAGGEYTLAVDIWSLGEIAFRALTGEQPFPIRSLKAYVKGTSPFPVEVLQAHGVSEEGCDFLNSLMAPIPKDRLTARDALSHIWIEHQKLSLAVSKIQSPTTGEKISLEYPTTEASARWSTVDAATPKPNILENPAVTGEPPNMPWPVKDTTSMTAYGETVASASSDHAFMLQDKQKALGVESRMPEGISSGASAVAFSPDGKLVAAASLDNSVKLWYSATGAVYRTLKGHSQRVYVVIFSPSGELLASASWDKTIKLWDPAAGEVCYTLDVQPNFVYAVTFRLVYHATLMNDILVDRYYGEAMGAISLGDSATGREWYRLEGHSCDSGQDNLFYAHPFSLAGQMMTYRGIREYRKEVGGSLFINTTLRKVHRTLLGRPVWSRVYNVAFSPDGRLVASTLLGGIVTLLHPSRGTIYHQLRGHTGRVYAITFSPDGKLLATASRDRTVRLWSSTTGAERQTLKGHSGPVKAVAFSSDGKLVASASLDKTVKLWDPTSGAVHQTLRGNSDEIYAVAFSPDGKLVASASSDKTVRLWDTVTGAGKYSLASS
ncbi:MAG: hypothetical protein M1840_001088 [Geoglossum simile]|nr:MAG: hypothetical protein M1840_001088 [Geoglossum simile]